MVGYGCVQCDPYPRVYPSQAVIPRFELCSRHGREPGRLDDAPCSPDGSIVDKDSSKRAEHCSVRPLLSPRLGSDGGASLPSISGFTPGVWCYRRLRRLPRRPSIQVDETAFSLPRARPLGRSGREPYSLEGLSRPPLHGTRRAPRSRHRRWRFRENRRGLLPHGA